jgi:hypothetical protein
LAGFMPIDRLISNRQPKEYAQRADNSASAVVFQSTGLVCRGAFIASGMRADFQFVKSGIAPSNLLPPPPGIDNPHPP